jgi:predicted dehydrogenase
MAVDYTKVLNGLECPFITIGRSLDSVATYHQVTGVEAQTGGIRSFLRQKPEVPEAAIVAVGIEQLAEVTELLLAYGVKRILLEKPGGLNKEEIVSLAEKAEEKNAEVYLAYNRRFYSSVLQAQQIIEEDGGVQSFHFEFTEWGHRVKDWKKTQNVLEHWFLGNSSHVVNLAFYLGGNPTEINCFTKGSLDWHPSAVAFTGAGATDRGTVFSYNANWTAPGRWNVEVLTNKHRLILCPLEKLQVQNLGKVTAEFYDLDDQLDQEYKPGLYHQVKLFLEQKTKDFCTIKEHAEHMQVYYQIANY